MLKKSSDIWRLTYQRFFSKYICICTFCQGPMYLVLMITMDRKCTFGIRMPIKRHMLYEVIYREMKHFRNYKTYRPNFGEIPVATKFYAAHHQLKDLSPEESLKIEKYFNKVSQSRALGPHNKYSSPVTHNQIYGWYTTPLVPLDRNDGRFYHPVLESTHTKTEVIIKMANPRKRRK